MFQNNNAHPWNILVKFNGYQSPVGDNNLISALSRENFCSEFPLTRVTHITVQVEQLYTVL